MNYMIRRVNDSASFAFLDIVTDFDNGTVTQLFGMVACIHVYDPLPTFAKDLTLLVPDMPVPPVEYGFVLTSRGKRMFAYVVVQKHAGFRQANFFEVSPFVLFLAAFGLRTMDGKTYPMRPLLDVIAPDDGIPLDHTVISPDSESYFGLREGVPDTAPWVPKSASNQVPNRTPHSQLLSHAPNGATTTNIAPADKVTPIYFELGAPCFHSMRVNGDFALMNLSKSE